MKIALIIIQMFGLLAMLASLFMLFRIKWVADQRIRILDEHYDDHVRLTSFNNMMWRFWIWDVNKFMGPPRYEIGHDGKSITCKTCNLTSFNPNDVEHRYCGKCHAFHWL